MRKSISEIKKIYRSGANLFLNLTPPLPLFERAKPSQGNLNFSANIYSSHELEKLFQQIAENGGVNSLNLRDNALGAKDAEIIAHYLGKTGIRVLNLSQNNINNEGAEMLAGSIFNLRELDLSENRIGYRGFQSLFGALHNNQSLRGLSLGGNSLFKMNVAGLCQDLVELVKNNKGLRYLNLDPMPALPNEEELKELGEVVDTHPKMEKILYAPRKGHPGRLESWKSEGSSPSWDFAREVSTSGSGTGSSTVDAVKDFSTILLVRIVRKIVADNPEIPLDNEAIKSLEKFAIERSADILLRGLNKKETKEFSDIWHGGFRQTRSQKLRDYGNESWEILTKEKEIEVPIDVAGEKGWKIVNLENAQELKEEGAALKHCVGGYSRQCISGESYILSLRKNGQPCSTLEVGKTANGILNKQHKAKRDADPSGLEKKIAQWLIAGVDAKAIPAFVLSATKRNASFTSLIGFDPFDDGKFKAVVSEFRNKILPSGKLTIPALTKNFNKDFLGELRMDDGMFDYPKGLPLKSLRVEEEKTREEQIKEKFVGVAQTALNRIFGQNEAGTPIAKASLIEGELFVFTDNKTSERLKSSLLKGHAEERNDGLKITGNLEKIRSDLTEAGKQEKKAQKASRRAKDDSDLPNTVVQNPELRSRDTNDLQRVV